VKIGSFLRLAHDIGHQNSPELRGWLEHGNPFIIPANVLTAKTTESHRPFITGKPGVGIGGITDGYGAGTGVECVKITYPRNLSTLHKKRTGMLLNRFHRSLPRSSAQKSFPLSLTRNAFVSKKP